MHADDMGMALGGSSEINIGGGRRFYHYTNEEGVKGITGISPEILNVGDEIVLKELKFGSGKNEFLSSGEGRIFITEKGVESTPGALGRIGILPDKQKYAIIFSEEAAFNQGVRVKAEWLDRSIWTIPKNTILKGNFILKRIKK